MTATNHANNGTNHGANHSSHRPLVGDEPRLTNPAADLIAELIQKLSPILASTNSRAIPNLRSGLGMLFMVARRISEGKTVLPDHGKTDTTLHFCHDPQAPRRPMPLLPKGIDFFASAKVQYATIGGGNVHVAPVVHFRTPGRTSNVEIRFPETIFIDALKVTVTLDSLLPFGESDRMASDMPDKVAAICATHIARQYSLCIAGGEKTWSFRLACKRGDKPGAGAVEVPVDAFRELAC